MSREESPWAVMCDGVAEDLPSCGKVFLTESEYDAQMERPNSLWKCPFCGASAQWDDENYEKWLDARMEAK